MADPTTTNRTLAVPTRGSDVGTWDVPVNGNMSLLDTIVGGVTSISSTGGTTTLNAAQLANGTISVSGALASDVILQFPAVQGWWSVENLCTNITSFGVFVVCGTALVQIGMPPGEITDIQININTPKYRNFGRIGTYVDIAVSTIPPWISRSTTPPFLNCDGATFSAGTYPVLAAILNGTTLPDSPGRVRIALDQGTNRMTVFNANVVRSAGGDQNLQAHTHANSLSDPGHFHAYNPSNASTGGGGSSFFIPIGNTSANTDVKTTGITLNNASAGSGGSQNVQPTYVGGLTLIRAA